MSRRKAGGMVCAAADCENKAYNCNMPFFSFPKDRERARTWLLACGREDLNEKLDNLRSYRLCAAHFADKMYLNDLKNRLLPSAVPSIFSSLEASSRNVGDEHDYAVNSWDAPSKRKVLKRDVVPSKNLPPDLLPEKIPRKTKRDNKAITSMLHVDQETNEVVDSREAYLVQRRSSYAAHRATETAEQREIRLAEQRLRAATHRAAETAEQREARLAANRLRNANRRTEETAEEREARLAAKRCQTAAKRNLETEEQRAHRLTKNRVRLREDRLTKSRIRMDTACNQETDVQTEMPGMACSVASCKSNSGTARKRGEIIRFFTFPKDKVLWKEWVRLCHRKDKLENIKNKRICSKHFTESDYDDAMKARLMNEIPKKLKSDCVPSLYLKSANIDTNRKPTSRDERMKIKQRKSTVQDILTSTSSQVDLIQDFLIPSLKRRRVLKKIAPSLDDLVNKSRKNFQDAPRPKALKSATRVKKKSQSDKADELSKRRNPKQSKLQSKVSTSQSHSQSATANATQVNSSHFEEVHIKDEPIDADPNDSSLYQELRDSIKTELDDSENCSESDPTNSETEKNIDSISIDKNHIVNVKEECSVSSEDESSVHDEIEETEQIPMFESVFVKEEPFDDDCPSGIFWKKKNK